MKKRVGVFEVVTGPTQYEVKTRDGELLAVAYDPRTAKFLASAPDFAEVLHAMVLGHDAEATLKGLSPPKCGCTHCARALDVLQDAGVER